MATDIEIATGLDSKDWTRHSRVKVMEAKACIQRKGSDLEARGFTVYFKSELKDRNPITVSVNNICLETSLRDQLKNSNHEEIT